MIWPVVSKLGMGPTSGSVARLPATLDETMWFGRQVVYIPRSFLMSEQDAVQFVAEHPFAVLFSTTRDGEPLATHLPLVRRDDGRLVGHLARANPHWRHLDGARVLAVFLGPHAYISPEWYGAMPNVPTWNYVTVHATGTCRLLTGQDQLAEALAVLTRFIE